MIRPAAKNITVDIDPEVTRMKFFTLTPSRHYNNRQRIFAGLVLLGVAIITVAVFISDPSQPHRFLPPCPFYTLTGLLCPGCGSGRAMINLFHGRFYAAWRMNPMALLLLPVPVLYVLNLIRAVLHGRSLPGLILPPKVVWTLSGIIIAYGILRNIPVYPFTLLQPYPLP